MIRRHAQRCRRRGLTLVMVLFLTFLLSTLSLAFVTLMLEDSRGSMTSGWQIMAAEAAEWGVETSLSYMGRGGNWQPAFDSERLVFYDVLNDAQPNGRDHLRAAAGGNGSIRVEVSPSETAEGASSRRLRMSDTSLPGGAALDLGQGHFARVEVEVQPVLTELASYGPGQVPVYLLRSRAEILQAASEGEPEILSVSLVEATVRPEVETTALFQVENLRSWDVQGGGRGSDHLADRILIPRQFETAGSVRVTGTDPRNPNAPWRDQAGNVRFEDPNSTSMVFRGQLSVSELFNLDGGGGAVTAGSPDQFPGGVVFGSDYLPLPSVQRYLNQDKNGDGVLGSGSIPAPSEMASAGQEWGLLARAAVDREGGGSSEGQFVSGYYRVDKDLVAEAHRLKPRQPDFDSSMPVTQQDYRPPVPEVEVLLKAGGFMEVRVWQANVGDGGISSSEGDLNSAAQQIMGPNAGPLGTTFHVDQLKNGVLYVEGGQVVVRSELSAGEASPFEGRLQIVASEESTRRGSVDSEGQASYGPASSSLYHDAAEEYFEWQKANLGSGEDSDPFKPPPYTAAELRQAHANGRIQSPVADLSGLGEAEPFWPPPPPSVKREGNLTIAGDLVKSPGESSLLGLTAENYLLISDRTLNQKARPNELIVDAVLTSFQHSLQLDWDNTSNNRVVGPGGQRLFNQFMTPGFNGKIVLNGSMLAPYSNVEGDLQGRGYPRQEFRHDSALERGAPPFQPRTLLSEYPNDQLSITWVIQSFVDRTSLGL